MPDKFIAIDIQGEDVLAKKLKGLPEAAKDAAADSVAEYLIGKQGRGGVLRQYPPQNYVTRKAAYGVTFFSEKQRRWFWANFNEGNLQIPGKRTQHYSKAWEQIGKGWQSIIANQTPYAEYLQDDVRQSRHEKMVGWQKLGNIIRSRLAQINRAADAGIKKALRKLKLD